MFLIAFLISLILTLSLFFFPKKEKITNKKIFSISVIVPAFNAENTIGRCLKSILDTNYKNLEIIVVNDGSSDSTEDEVKKFEKYGVKLINQKNQGKFSALNNGFKFSKNYIIFALDSDTFVAKNCFSEIIKYFNKGVAAVIPRKMAENRKNQLSFLQHIHFLIASSYLEIQSKLNKFYFLGFPAIAATREAWISNNGFRFKVADDADFILRLGEKGWKVRYATSTYVNTLVPDTFRKFLVQNIRWNKGHMEMIFSHWKFLIKNIHWLLFIQPQLVFGLIMIIVYGLSLFISGKEIVYIAANFVETLFENYKIILSFLKEYFFLGLYSGLPNFLLKFLIAVSISFIFFAFLIKFNNKNISNNKIFLYSALFLPIIGIVTFFSYILVVRDLLFYHRIRRSSF